MAFSVEESRRSCRLGASAAVSARAETTKNAEATKLHKPTSSKDHMNNAQTYSSEVFAAYAEKMRNAIDSALLGAFALPVPSEEKAFLYRPLENFIAAGGKRLRPTLVCLAAEATGANPHDALPVAASLEYFQAAALIHDDIADQSKTRRGEQCLYLQEGLGMALNQGDLALIESYASIVEDETISPALAHKLLVEICKMQRYTTEGQALDLGWVREKNWDVTPQDYLRMATLKTAWYTVASPLVLGALFGLQQASDADSCLEHLRAFGLDLGVAFQIIDDVLNLKGDPAQQGKDFRSDITEGKRTLLTTYALQNLDASNKEKLLQILTAHTTDADELASAVGLIEDSGAFAYADKIVKDLLTRAETSFSAAHLIASDAKNALESLASYVSERTH